MQKRARVFIGLGSNVDSRLDYLQAAIDAIHYQVGSIINTSSCYETPALGFVGDPFLNACVEIRTYWSAELLISKLLHIEENLGRNRHKDGQYHARTIDIDILFYGDEIIENNILSVPHPRLELRRFVLQPMVEIASDVQHPKLKQSMANLLQVCQDHSVIKQTKDLLKNPLHSINLSRYNFITIEGNIGAGKSSLTQMMAQDFNAKSIFERFADNPFLPKFYKDQERYAFTLEMSFLADRYQQISEDLAQLDLFKDFIIADYDVFKSLIFSKITLSEEEFLLYRKLFYQVYKDIKRPDLYVYLHQDIDKLRANIKKRGREYERQLGTEYLNEIHKGYSEFIKNNSQVRVKIIDITNRDFVEDRHDYIWVLNQIQS